MDCNIENGFYNNLLQRYGIHTYQLVKKLSRLSYKLASIQNRKIFLLECKRNGIFPKHIDNNFKSVYLSLLDGHPFVYLIDRIVKTMKISVINIEIKITHWKLDKLSRELSLVKRKLSNSIPTELFKRCVADHNEKYEKAFARIKLNNIKKITALGCESLAFKNINIIGKNKFIFNYSDTPLPGYVENILSLPAKFGLPLQGKEIPIPTIIKDIEFGVSCVNIEGIEEDCLKRLRNIVRAKAVYAVTKFYNREINNNLDGVSRKLMKDVKLTGQFLKTNNDLIITRADKGGATVIMKKIEYNQAMNDMISDHRIYKKIEKDPTTVYQNRINKLVSKLIHKGVIDKTVGRSLKTHNAVAPKIYGLRKVHKTGCKLRPVVSCINTPCYELASFLHSLLVPIIEKLPYGVKNSTQLVEKVKKIELLEDHLLVSLDVVSLFTMIPKELVLKIFDEEWEEFKEYIKMPREAIIELVDICFSTSYFRYQDEFYLQLDGTSMGNPASPTLANVVMYYVIKNILKKLPFEIPFIFLYVDDTLAAVPVHEKDNLLKHFNSFHPNIQFTMEVETEGRISFLDTLVIRTVEEFLVRVTKYMWARRNNTWGLDYINMSTVVRT